MRRAALAGLLAFAYAAAPASAEAQSFDTAQDLLRLEAELETIQIDGLYLFGGGFATLGGAVGIGASAAWLAEESGDIAGPAATLVTFGVVAVVGIVLVALGIVDALDVAARRGRLERRRDALRASATGMFRIGLGSGGELRIR